ncbi:MAG: XcyI family restriction endonuclease [Armatimonadota bacterium]
MSSMTYPVFKPDLQVSFYYRLQILKERYLSDALRKAVSAVELSLIDKQLSILVDSLSLQKTASFGLRGELFFPVPCLLERDPFLLGYYRLLYGFSQKAFYRGPLSKFKRLEEEGTASPDLQAELPALCESLVQTAELLVDGIDVLALSTITELQLLTIGPQLRGGENTRLGQDASKQFYSLLKLIVSTYLVESTEHTIIIENDSKRHVVIEFAADPDVTITETMTSDTRPLVSIEIKGGRDYSNIHNRLGEAEKSHLKAKRIGFFEFWTITRVTLDKNATRESPTTSRFFNLDEISDANSKAYQSFCDILRSILSIHL